jgi:hypothetical protein
MKTSRSSARLVVVGLAAAAALPLLSDTVSAADHLDAPKTMMNQAADITDVYAWHTDDAKVVAVVNFSGLIESGVEPKFDSKVVYGIHIDNDADGVADHDVWFRFGQNGAGDWGIQAVGIPGGTPTVSGPLNTSIDAGLGLRLWAGLRDDPFFFDLDGFKATLSSSTLSFNKDNDTFAGTNVTSIVVEMSTDAVVGAGSTFQLWASTRA